MRGDRLTAAVYWTAIAVFLAGVVVLVVGAAADLESLRIPGEIVIVAAWPIAASGAVLDILRHSDHHHPAD